MVWFHEVCFGLLRVREQWWYPFVVCGCLGRFLDDREENRREAYCLDSRLAVGEGCSIAISAVERSRKLQQLVSFCVML